MGEMKASARGPDGSAFSGGGVGTSTVSNWSTVFVQWDANRNERHKTHANGPHADKTRATIPDKSKDVNMLRRLGNNFPLPFAQFNFKIRYEDFVSNY